MDRLNAPASFATSRLIRLPRSIAAPVSKTTFFRLSIMMIGVGFLALLCIVCGAIWLVDRAERYSDALQVARQQSGALTRLLSLAQDAETGQRGYLLAGTDPYLKPYQEATSSIPMVLDNLAPAIGSDAAQRRRFDELSAVLTKKLAELEDTVNLARAGRRDEALQLLRTDKGRELMERLRSVISEMLGDADVRVANALNNERDAIAFMWRLVVVGALVVVLVGAVVLWMGIAYTRQLDRNRSEIQTLNASLEKRVEERTADLARANEEIQRFAYIVTHDLRAPLVNIMGFTSELDASLDAIRTYVEAPEITAIVPAEVKQAAAEDLPEAIGFIRSSTRKMDGLINAILKLSREGRRELKPERITLDALLRAIADSMQHQIMEAGGEVVIEGRVSPIVTDRLAVEQIFGNLLDNAVKFRRFDTPLAIRIRLSDERGQRVSVTVEDNGRGIAPQDFERVFDLFRRAGAQDRPGEGMGLAYVRNTTRNIGGDIKLQSELGRGTTFIVTLPRVLRS
ncbi:MAG TPA: CHASE3 domain-containing protein [Roseiarcus sp.]|nr:CHASE3 domain-containing protein [Roseiarcus sp.]